MKLGIYFSLVVHIDFSWVFIPFWYYIWQAYNNIISASKNICIISTTLYGVRKITFCTKKKCSDSFVIGWLNIVWTRFKDGYQQWESTPQMQIAAESQQIDLTTTTSKKESQWASSNGGQAKIDGRECFAMFLVRLARNHLLWTALLRPNS